MIKSGTRNALTISGRAVLLAMLGGSATSALALQAGVEGRSEESAEIPSSSSDIVVTATRREGRILDIPQSIQAFGGDTLERIAAASLSDILNKLSGVSGFSTGTGKTQFNVRGVQSVSGSAIDASTVGYYVDETPLASAAITPDVLLFDLERVEVLKGPQGTLYGEGSLGGTIRLVTVQPRFDSIEGGVLADVGTVRNGDISTRLSARANVPLSETAAVRLVASWVDNGGFIDDATSGASNVNSSELSNLRAAIRWKPVEQLDLVGSWMRQRSSGGSDAFEAPGEDLALRQAFPQRFRDRFDLGSLTARYSGDSFQAVYAGARYDRQRNELRDERDSGLLLEEALGLPLQQGLREDTTSPERTWTHELRLLSTGDGPVGWLVGAFHKNRQVGIDSTSFAPDIEEIAPGLGQVFSLDIDTRFKETAAFGEVSFRPTSSIRAIVGGRFFRQTYRGTSSGTLIAVDDETGAPIITDTGVQAIAQTTERFLAKASLDWKPSESSLLYLLFSQGARGGGVNTRLFLPEIPRTYAPDFVDNFEAGFKFASVDRRFTFNLAVYQINWRDLQVPVVPSEGISFITNAGRARSRGFELDASFRPAEALLLGGSFALIDSRLRTPLILSAPGSEADVRVPAGARVPLVARTKFNLYADLNLPVSKDVSATGRLDIEHVGRRLNNLPIDLNGALSEAPTGLPAYTLVNLRAGAERGEFALSLYVDNLFDKKALLEGSTPDVEGFLVNRPRTVGLTFRAGF